MNRDKRKVFGIGFHRTGTTTLQTALEELGYRVTGMTETDWNAYANGRFDLLSNTVDRFDGFRDMPWPLMYEWLYLRYPTARFILTVRDDIAWARSCAATYKSRPHAMFPVIYGFESFAGNEARARVVYHAHSDKVRKFFADKPDQFLEVDFTNNPDWKTLCAFLDEAVPSRPFPHANRRPKSLVSRLFWAVARRVAPSYYRKRMRDRS